MLVQINGWQDTVPSMEIRFDGKLVANGSATGYINPVLDIGILQSRVLLEFVGLKYDHKEGLAEIVNHRKTDDVCIELSGLSKVSVSDAINGLDIPSGRIKKGFVYVLRMANKKLAHMTNGFKPDDDEIRMMADAFFAIIKMMEHYFYEPLEIEREIFVTVNLG